MQLKVMNSPFNQEQVELLNQLLPTLTDSQKAWLSGYIAASQSQEVSGGVSTEQTNVQTAPTIPEVKVTPISKEVTILFGSQTGNAQSLAKQTKQALTEQGFDVTLLSMNDFKPNSLKKVQNLLILVSTHGEGDPPDTAISFHEFLHGKRAPKLEELSFSVLSLGDSSYEFFCQTGKEFDQKLEELGGKRIHPRVDCDLDFDEPAAEWIAGIVQAFNEATSVNQTSSSSLIETASIPATTQASNYSRTNPFQAEVLENINLNGQGSNKETRHLEISLEGSGLTYKPGDSLGIIPKNDPKLVELLLKELQWSEDEIVTVNKQGDVLPLKEALISYFEITVLTKPLLENLAKLSANEELHNLLAPENKDKLKEYLNGRDLLDVVQDYGPFSGSIQDFIAHLRKIPGRLYSIASSLEANPEEVHLTIGAVRYESFGRNRNGVCSILCSERIEPGDTLPVYIQSNDNFKLPENPETPIIMVGPGTGVAPFRAFMQEREEIGATGKSWLFFGDQHFVTDFLYQIEWQGWLKDGNLTKMDVAFSRDKAEKVYVQHRMLEHSKELFNWLEEGAVVYICGDEKNMAHDVHETLISIIEKEGHFSKTEAQEYLANMQQQKRYQRDVY
ncbi:sulfite reductase subunit alpha [Alkalihalobacillus alcalophilus ATCC 27647 = CGMCC 1.3604]|uniref:assimilatory sulfite reductase (NADPH) n=1 Tax=Alkalihalobacillus alcalophilus ATCC 27647 = CGMCC 1.3604 TaxID=1218173 RepID=A0A094XCL1_ALKAL|nr:assimilatory sulfite reductase (NADPH) flavoprotein subunit [Alkalihalobacillus alcalophilus]KGA96540.1 sulfite reductase [NADPH] flavoprotein alpha-component [Alkalihalobacillus alcalophilus ATCC 27647 = CGMCC 1.3604]MED1564153.1 assimilatory sulfite reductase (NADPH) flavoprotein subunit [Alkalihalobacillus alcalophilus]THG91836.1 sulfite reductase subunit alpha [Alkalihalobacillus alcalophilus ATCC 27647 = CGMCC 1.3604]